MTTGQFEAVGAQIRNPSRGKPIHVARMETGLFTNRSALHDPAQFVISKFYGGYIDALINGSNMEVSNALTLIRRPGHTQFSTQVIPTPPLIFYNWRKTDTSLNLVVDTAPASFILTPSTITQIFTKNVAGGAGQGYYQGVGNTLYFGDGVDLLKFDGTNTWNWGIVPPSAAPTVVATGTASSSTLWQANTNFTPMGFIVDQNGFTEQLISVNADGSNPNSQFGTSGNGEPNWNQSLYQTTTESSGTPIVWKNLGAIQPWQASTQYGDGGFAGVAAPVAIYDVVTQSVFINFNNHGGLSTSGTKQPPFTANGGPYWDNQCHWFFVGTFSQMQFWKPGTNYTQWYGQAGITHLPSQMAIEPSGLPPQNNQSVFLQIPTNTGTSGTNNPPAFQQVFGVTKRDSQLQWLNCGNATWAANTAYVPWTAPGTAFSAIQDPNGNMQVCFSGIHSGTTQPGAAWKANFAYALNATIVDSNNNLQTVTTAGTSGKSATISSVTINNGVATYTTTAAHGFSTGQFVTCTGVNGANGIYNVTRALITSTPLTTTFTIALNFGNSVGSGNSGTAFAGPTWNTTLNGTTTDGGVTWTNGGQAVGWGTTYGATTTDNQIVWKCVGPPLTWVANTIWHLPVSGFSPPSPSQSFGGSIIIDNQNPPNVENCTIAGKSGTIQPTWASSGIQTQDNTQGTGPVWFNSGAQSPLSLTWTKSHSWGYSFKSLSNGDPFAAVGPSPLAGGGLVPPGITSASSAGLNNYAWSGIPTGSRSGQVSTSSPAFTFSTAGTAQVVSVSGFGSTDPQVDTIVIWRDADGGGPTNMFELTEIPAPQPIGGVAQPWTFKDFLPDLPSGTGVVETATSTSYPGLNNFISAPINKVNNPPPAGFLPMAYHFGRIWGAVKNTVFISAGPETVTGVGNESFNPVEFFTFNSPVTKIVPTATGILVFLTSDVYGIEGGPVFSSFFSTPLIPGVGLLNFAALDVHGGVIYLYTSDNQFLSIDPSGGVNRMGGPIADKLAAFNAQNVFITVHEAGNDNAIFTADGATGWYRLNPNQFPNGNAVWSTFATIGGGAGAVQSIEVSKGVHKLLVGGTGNNQPVLQRDFSTFTDNGTPYSCFFTMGSISLCNPGQIAGITFVNLRATKTGTTPAVSYLLNEVNGTFQSFPRAQAYPWQIFGATGAAASLYSNAYYFRDTGNPALAEHMQVQVSFPAENFANEVLSMTIYGVVEQPPEL